MTNRKRGDRRQFSRRPIARPTSFRAISRKIRQEAMAKKMAEQQIKTQQQKVRSDVSKIVADLNAGRITSIEQIPLNLRQYIELPKDYFVKVAQFKKQEEEFARQQREINEWKQAESLAGKIQVGKTIRYDPKSAVGKKINAFLDNWALASARRAHGGSGAVWSAPNIKVTKAERKKAQQDQISKTIKDWKAGKISKVDASSIVKIIQRGGGKGAAADLQKFASFQASRARRKEIKAAKAAIAEEALKYKITESNVKGKLLVTFPNGRKTLISSTGRVNIGKDLAGEQLVFQDGILRKINDRDLFEEKLKPVIVEKPKDEIISIKRLRDLSNKWKADTTNTKNRFRSANKRGDLDRLNELRRLGKNRTQSETSEYIRLQKETAKNYELGGEFIMKTIGRSLINMGVGSVDLINALNKNPKETLVALPPAIWLGVKEDFNRVMSGDPLEITEIGAEYWTFGKVLGFAGKGAKTGIKTSYAIGNKLSPKYFSRITPKLFAPPVTLRGVAIKTVVGRRATASVKKALANPAVRKKVKAFNKKLKIDKLKVGRKLNVIQTKSRRIKRRVKRRVRIVKTKRKIKKIQRKFKKDYSKELKQAKKIRAKARKKGRTLNIVAPDYRKVIDLIDDLVVGVAKVKALDFISKHIRAGGKLTVEQGKTFIKAVEKELREAIRKTPEFKKLKELSKQPRTESVKLIRQGKIKRARLFLTSLTKKVEKTRLAKRMKVVLSRVKRGVRIPIRKVKKVKRKIVKKRKIKKIKLKKKKEFLKDLQRARRIRAKARKKGRTMTIGSDDYAKAIVFMEDFVKSLAKVKTNKFVKQMKSKGVKISASKQKELTNAITKFLQKKLKDDTTFKQLQKSAMINKPFTLRLIKQGRLKTAKIHIKNLSFKIRKAPVTRKLTSLIRRVKRLPKKIKKKRKLKKLRKEALRIRKLTIRYQMEKARPIRKVTLEQLRKSSNISKMNKFIDSLFDEMGRRQKIDISAVKFKQMKNLMKKKMRRAIKKNDKTEINNFMQAVRKLTSDMNKKTSNPNVKVVDVKARPKRIRTIRDFETVKPKGSYVQVKSGQTVLLQRVKLKTKKVTKQKLKIVSVQKKKLNLKPLIDYIIKSLSIVAIKNALATGQDAAAITTPAQLKKVLQDFAPDLKAAQALSPKLNVANDVLSKLRSRLRTRPRLRLRPRVKKIPKKKKPVIRLKREKPKTKILSKKVMGYNVYAKKRGRFVKQNAYPLPIRNARDLMAYTLDNTLVRTGEVVPVGKVKRVGILGKAIAGSYAKKKRKLRQFKKRRKKKIGLVFGYIEKRKFISDTQREKAQLKAARRKAQKKKPTKKVKRVKRKIVKKRKPLRRKTTRKIIVKKGIRSSPRKTTKRKPVRKKPVKGRKPVKKKRRR